MLQHPPGGLPDIDRTLLGIGCRLVFVPKDVVRPGVPGLCPQWGADQLYGRFPFLLISDGSLPTSTDGWPEPLPMNRFRPNLVVTGFQPFAEDGWRRIRIGSVTFQVA